jgi:hypothetical protein
MVPATSFSSSSSLGFRAGVEETIILIEAMYLYISVTLGQYEGCTHLWFQRELELSGKWHLSWDMAIQAWLRGCTPGTGGW